MKAFLHVVIPATLILTCCSDTKRSFDQSADSGAGGAAGTDGASGSESGGTGQGEAGSGVGGNGGAIGDPQTVATPFTAGPCVVTPTEASVEAFARGDNQRIHRRVLKGADAGVWNELSDLDTSGIDVRSDLDCSADVGSMYLVALGNQPLGAYLRAAGSSNVFNPFVRELEPAIFVEGVALSSRNFSVGSLLVGVRNSGFAVADVSGDLVTDLPVPSLAGASLVSAPDVTYFSAYNSGNTHVVAFDDAGALVHTRYQDTATTSGWQEPTFIESPPGEAYQFSPSICHTYYVPNGAYPRRHLVVVAAGTLRYSISDEFEPVFSAWELMGEAEVASAPDCAVESDGTVHVVALGAAGNVVYAHGTAGSFVIENLGGY